MKYVLFVCTQNAGRSQMAQAFFERHGPDDVRAESAGDQPADWAITLACGAQCPYVPSVVEDWDVADPPGRPLEEVRKCAPS
jgi:protein-tyrosine-phosphatase